MDARSGFQRNYFIFVNEDTGYEAGQKPSGHIRLEVRDGRGRLHAAIQNLRPGNGRFDYALYLWCSGSSARMPVYAGNLGLRPGKAELEWIFDPADVGRSGVPIEYFDVFAVIAESAGNEYSLACPLAAYRNKRVDWRNDFRLSRMVKKPAQAEIKPLPKFEAKPETKPVTLLETKPEMKPEMKPENKPENKSEPVSESAPPEAKVQKPFYVSEPVQMGDQVQEQQQQQAGPVQAGGQPLSYQEATAPAGDQPQIYQEATTPAGDQVQVYQEATTPSGDQPQIYQEATAPAGDQAQVYQYPAGQQTAQFYGAEPYIPYPVYQEQPLNTYDPYQIYTQQPQMYSPYQAYPQQQVQPYGSGQPFETGQEEGYQEAVQQPAETEQLSAGQTEVVPVQREQTEETQAAQADDDILTPGESGRQPESIEKGQEKTAAQTEYQYRESNGNVDTGCLYLNGNICGAFLNTAPGNTSPCDACHIHRGAPAEQVQSAGDLSRLKAILDGNFEESDPFHSKRSDYLWWKITNPVNLNNILYQNNIRSPLMFNPAVMLAHYKYHHLIVGIFTRKDGKKFVVCGVPGMHMVDRKPFGDLSKWVQADGSKSRYGAFGYWLVYINPEDGKILNLNQE